MFDLSSLPVVLFGTALFSFAYAAYAFEYRKISNESTKLEEA